LEEKYPLFFDYIPITYMWGSLKITMPGPICKREAYNVEEYTLCSVIFTDDIL
jgi:hypothetical protein